LLHGRKTATGIDDTGAEASITISYPSVRRIDPTSRMGT